MKTYKKPAGTKPNHQLFRNKVLNDIFCQTPKDTKEFIDASFEAFQEADANLLPDREYRAYVATFVAGIIETAFELGWREAMFNVCVAASAKEQKGGKA